MNGERQFDEDTAADAYCAALPPGQLECFRVDAIDRLGIPTYSAAFWSAGGTDDGFGFGYGPTDAGARVGAMGELIEGAAAHRALARMPRRRGSYEGLRAELGAGAVLDPRTGCLDAGSPYTPAMPLDWVAARRYPDGDTVWVPLAFAASYESEVPPAERLALPVTNGLGAGLTIERALAHGLLELLQRDGNGLRFRALDAGVALDLDEVRDPATRALLARLDAAGVDVIAKLASTEFGIVNLYVVGTDRPGRESALPIVDSACGEAADPSRERALQKALLEFASARTRKAFSFGPLDGVARVAPPAYMRRVEAQSIDGEEPRALEAMIEWMRLDGAAMRALLADTVLAVRERRPFSALPETPDVADTTPRGRLADIAGRLQAAGFDTLYLDFVLDPATGVRAAKVIVPGLEVETMSYGRIGERNARRLLERGDGLVGFGPPPPGARPIVLTGEAYERLGGRPWLDWPAVLRTVGPLYPLYREPSRHSVALALARRQHG